jgi:hypothetical protein
MLTDPSAATIKCKLWGDKSSFNPELNSKYEFNCLEVNNRDNTPELQSTSITSMTKLEQETLEEGTINCEIEVIEVDEE